MLLLVLFFLGVVAFLAFAPQEVVRAGLVLMWVVMAGGCAASIIQAAAGRL